MALYLSRLNSKFTLKDRKMEIKRVERMLMFFNPPLQGMESLGTMALGELQSPVEYRNKFYALAVGALRASLATCLWPPFYGHIL